MTSLDDLRRGARDRPRCRECQVRLDVHQPDEERPEHLLGTCAGCGDWYLIEVGRDGPRRSSSTCRTSARSAGNGVGQAARAEAGREAGGRGRDPPGSTRAGSGRALSRSGFRLLRPVFFAFVARDRPGFSPAGAGLRLGDAPGRGPGAAGLDGGGRPPARSGGRLGQEEVELAAVDVDAGDPDLDPVAQPVAAARAAADQGVRPRFEVVVVVGQAGDVDQALDRQLDEPAEEAEVLDADDDRVESLADVLLEVGQELDLDQLALGRLGPALGPGAVLGQDGQLVVVALGLLARRAAR